MKHYALILISVAWAVQVQASDPWYCLPRPLSWRPVYTYRAGDQVLVTGQRDGTDFTRRGGYRPPGIDRR